MNNIEMAVKQNEFQQFEYLLKKIKSAEFYIEPFKHIEILDFLSEEHFNLVVSSEQVAISEIDSADTLVDTLLKVGYEPIVFPGCTTSVRDYLKWLKGQSSHNNHEVCEGFGLTLRLKDIKSQILIDLNKFFKSSLLKEALEEKFSIKKATYVDSGLQKYLHGYEISPHPDIRKKALTYMLNVNPSSHSENLNIHTHYLVFKPEKRFIGEFWRYNEDYDRCWVPWEWCHTIKQQRQNNSIVIFSPAWDTLHAVKLSYDHLKMQRTQFYGNLWYKDFPEIEKPQYDQFVFQTSPDPKARSSRSILSSFLSKEK